MSLIPCISMSMKIVNPLIACSNVLNSWNNWFGTSLPISQALLDYSFLQHSPEMRFVFEDDKNIFLVKQFDKRYHLHLWSPEAGVDKGRLRANLIDIAKLLGGDSITIGSGDRHIFPGIPLPQCRLPWSQITEARGPSVVDLVGDLESMKSFEIPLAADFRLSPIDNEKIKTEILNFVATEFPGRWHREIVEDFEKGFQVHYFAYYEKNQILGYVRLYGWRNDYLAPGVYFNSENNSKNAGLGPIGVARAARGRGLGKILLTLSWALLRSKGCQKVRVDWTTEREFYQGRGLRIVQEYQPSNWNYRR